LLRRASRVSYYLNKNKILPSNATEEQIITAEKRNEEHNLFLNSVYAKKFKETAKEIREQKNKLANEKKVFENEKKVFENEKKILQREKNILARKRKNISLQDNRGRKKKKNDVISLIDSDDEYLGEIHALPLDQEFFDGIEW